MVYGYMLENANTTYLIDNRPLMQAFISYNVTEESIFIDSIDNSARPEFYLLLNALENGDSVIVRSIADLADTTDMVLYILGSFEDSGVKVISVSEPMYDYNSYMLLEYGVKIAKSLSEKKRLLGIAKAVSAGRMGRKVDETAKDTVLRLKNAGFAGEEIQKLCGISRSTYFRYIRK